MTYTVVQVRAGGDHRVRPLPLIVLAVNDDGDKVEWRTTDRVRVGDRFALDLAPVAL